MVLLWMFSLFSKGEMDFLKVLSLLALRTILFLCSTEGCYSAENAEVSEKLMLALVGWASFFMRTNEYNG